ncbi:helix-turn-helix domain-containing protein [Myroides pelagicus]|uniref:Helix-turn-helix domain-containing protein n=1 Tax=Myroides pelagicus TaxID=270914 RepID=A0A7K1GLC7_9FLAO|nr:AraC family transcriptional regulator [Myroides pelagicus]MEC4113445.1 AraC family transcriptional regulator [Myroides pelagicus]MTH29243.1 helix-turn-helix domain-containing protein [Myroides pelagicus]
MIKNNHFAFNLNNKEVLTNSLSHIKDYFISPIFNTEEELALASPIKTIALDIQQSGVLLLLFNNSLSTTTHYLFYSVSTNKNYTIEFTTVDKTYNFFFIYIPLTKEHLLTIEQTTHNNLTQLNTQHELSNQFIDQSPTITSEMLGVLHLIKNCTKCDTFKILFLENKIHELLLLVLEDRHLQHQSNELITKEDKEKIVLAQRILIENYNKRITIQELAKRVGTNEFKLKKQFKVVYNNTIYTYLTAYIMEKAKIKMESGQYSIKEIAELLGYSSQNHFSTAFKRYYGCPPSVLLKAK